MILGPITFKEGNEISVNPNAKRVYVICGSQCVRLVTFSSEPLVEPSDIAGIDGLLGLGGIGGYWRYKWDIE